MHLHLLIFLFFFFNDTATTEIYTLSLHDALPISEPQGMELSRGAMALMRTSNPALNAKTFVDVRRDPTAPAMTVEGDRKSTRLNSSHDQISYAVFCLKKKKKNDTERKMAPQQPSD